MRFYSRLSTLAFLINAKKLLMKKIFLFVIAAMNLQLLSAQMDLPASGGNVRAKITEEVGITDISISYSRPDVNGREGKIWGQLITPGFSSQSFVTNKNTAPWRGGANENTIISFEHDVTVEGKSLKAGTYGLFFAYSPDKTTVIFSNQTNGWGSYYYEDKYDALRVDVKPVVLDKTVEWLKYEFIEQKPKHCVIAVMWEKIMIPFKVEVDVNNIVVNRLREQVTGQKGFNQLNLTAAANFCLNNDINLEEALSWAQRASGFKSYATLRTLATAYEKLKRLKEADSVMVEALAMANVNQYVNYGRTLITARRADKAVEVLTAAKTKFGEGFAVNNALMFAYSAKADYRNALAFADKAMGQASNEGKKTLEGQMAKLREGKDINPTN
jgi:hypothetical protein